LAASPSSVFISETSFIECNTLVAVLNDPGVFPVVIALEQWFAVGSQVPFTYNNSTGVVLTADDMLLAPPTCGTVASISSHPTSDSGTVASISSHPTSDSGTVASISSHPTSDTAAWMTSPVATSDAPSTLNPVTTSDPPPVSPVVVEISAGLQFLPSCSVAQPCALVIVTAGQHEVQLSEDTCLWHSNRTVFEEDASLEVGNAVEGSYCLFSFSQLEGWPHLTLAGSSECLTAELERTTEAIYIRIESTTCSSCRSSLFSD
jgi:hypothetical protein